MAALPAIGRAAVLTAPGRRFELRELPVPDPEPDAMVVRVLATTICGSDLHVYDGSTPSALPSVLGHEICGGIVAFGDGPRLDSFGTPIAEGDRIIWTQGYCGHCHECSVLKEPVLCANRRTAMQDPDAFPYVSGGFSEYCYVWPTAERIRVPDDVPDTWAAIASCAGRTVTRAHRSLGQFDPSQTVVIQGTGPIGLLACAFYSLLGPRRLIVIGAPKERLRLASEWGADAVIDITVEAAPDRAEHVRELTGGRGADVVFEMSGGRTAFAEGVDLVAPGGRYIVIGQVFPSQQAIDASLITRRQLKITGSVSAEGVDQLRAISFLARNRDRFDWNALLSPPRGFAGVDEAVRAMAELREIKPVFIPG
jgi:L-iditol 2-dehydrogenase